MPITESENPSVRELKGMHLWHDDLSSCSQRVRAVLAEKGLEWESHLLIIPKGENLTPEFLAINPKGLVPVFVHDGILITESMDIIDYLDRTFPDPPMRPAAPEAIQQMKHWMDITDQAQYDLKVLSHEFIFRAVRDISAEQSEIFENDVKNDVLVDFIRIYKQGDKLPDDMISESVNNTDRWFRDLDAALTSRDWVVSDRLTLADIACMPNVHRYELMDWPLEKYPHVVKWHNHIKATKAYGSGILDWEPPHVRERLSEYVQTRGKDGYHVACFGVLAA